LPKGATHKSQSKNQKSQIFLTPITGSGKEKTKAPSAVRQHLAEKVPAGRLFKKVQIQGP
jgi:hypothetical protein